MSPAFGVEVPPADVLVDWRSYVPEAVRKLWGRLDNEARVAVFVTAESIAAAERKARGDALRRMNDEVDNALRFGRRS